MNIETLYGEVVGDKEGVEQISEGEGQFDNQYEINYTEAEE